MNKDQFDYIAKFYDFIAAIVFGKAIQEIQLKHLPKIKKKSRVLIIGGGSGKILKKIDELGIASEVIYIEKSPKMTALAKKIKTKTPVKFINTSFENAKDYGRFDLIITNFFVDLLNEKQFQNFIPFIYSLLNDNGKWIVTDFRIHERFPLRSLHKLIHFSMVSFFKVTVNLQNTTLFNYHTLIHESRFFQAESKKYAYMHMMFSSIFKKRKI
ncbi:class I SAM-dependent methyltransferase [Flammeovirga sp. EKP202]|uniref:class I SAM-dependent methyltransferase n=1 Tax=Flammeovirga sp. EKP202 TaxID=2770592 RepID=UPI00165F4FEB|nr:class I SAM-dependent methyltransferase [Flammeovirga sp. EKP202]MBD0404262.1 methyltransferase domain-containing protein [Flammeovirga sp. EKP202]